MGSGNTGSRDPQVTRLHPIGELRRSSDYQTAPRQFRHQGLDVNISPQRFNPRSVACLVYQKVFRCTEVHPAAIMSNEVTDFLRSVKELQERREEEDEARSRELEEKFLQEKRERQARRAGTSAAVLYCHCIAFPSKFLFSFISWQGDLFSASACYQNIGMPKERVGSRPVPYRFQPILSWLYH